ncbi:MAG: AsnC family transcriptional regulator [Hyphomicrobiales bacterium]|nr:MAG: AsnC family transcriptional regulator [Hyphomicrobiales bacterium]
MDNLDEFDIKLLKLLQANGKLSNQELADAVHLSPSQCSRRRAALEEAGIIRSYHAMLDKHALGFDLTVFINVMLNTHNRNNAKRFGQLIERLDNVQEAYALTGEMDYQIKLVVRDLSELSRIINDEIMPHESVQTIKSSIVLNTIKFSRELPLS